MEGKAMMALARFPERGLVRFRRRCRLRNKKYTCLGFVKSTGSRSKAGYLDVVILDVNGNAIDQHYRRKTLFMEPGVWTPIATTIDFPALKSSSLGKWKEPATMRLQLNLGSLDPGGKVYVDDCGIYMQESEGSKAARQ
jgi:hypothetical protein